MSAWGSPASPVMPWRTPRGLVNAMVDDVSKVLLPGSQGGLAPGVGHPSHAEPRWKPLTHGGHGRWRTRPRMLRGRKWSTR
jgi:hypothetical protein